MVVTSLKPWRHDSQPGVSGIAGAVHFQMNRMAAVMLRSCVLELIFPALLQERDLVSQAYLFSMRGGALVGDTQ
jgi:hypothetical protein